MKRFLQRRVLPLLCCLSLTVGLFSYQPPKAKALLTEASLATSVIWTFMQSAGLSFSGNNAGSQAWIDSCQSWYNKFMESKEDNAGGFVGWLGYDSWSAFLADIRYQKNPTNLGYQMFIPKAISSKLAEFTQWFIGELGLTSGGESKPVVSTPGGYRLYLADGDFIALGSFSSAGKYGIKYYTPGSILFDVTKDMYANYKDYFWNYQLPNGNRIKFWLNSTDAKVVFGAEFYDADGVYRGGSNTAPEYNFYLFNLGVQYVDKVGLAIADDGNTILPILHGCNEEDEYHYGRWFQQTTNRPWNSRLTIKNLALSSSETSAIDAAQPGAIDIPVDDTGDRATVITIPGLDTEIAGINDLLQQILDKLAANELTTSATIAQQPTPEQPDEEKPDLNGLGLPALGAALVTRFPFSIPWDVVKGIKLLAAPAEAPRWEVDFLEPIAGRVGGWKGSTKVVIDMGEYPIIGQVCRWTSMIGFCLILASGTKKLIWTA